MIERIDCQVLATELSNLRSKNASNVDLLFSTTIALEELKSCPTLLGAFAICPTLTKELDETRVSLKKSEKTSNLLVLAVLSVMALWIGLMSWPVIRSG